MATHRDWIEAHKDYPHEDWCLVWPFSREKRVGRGQMSKEGGGHDWAHRVMCEAVHGPAPPDQPQAAHSCGNGHEGCVNPRHLSWATNSENQLQRYAQGRGNPNANGNISMFTPEQIAEIQSLYGQMTQMEIAARFNCSLGTVQYYLKYREQRGHTGGKIKHWSPDEEKLLERLLTKERCTYPEAAKVIGRDSGSVAGKARRMGLKSGFQVTKITDRPGFSFSNGSRNQEAE
jgi:DNA-binding CsgD family transcriptional regulator